MKLYFVRHGKTKGNAEGRYVGRTDEPLLESSRESLKMEQLPLVDLVVASPMLRCHQTAEILYPRQEIWICNGLQEMDFGEFEYKNYEELNSNPTYQAYIDSNGQVEFPGSEPLEHFKKRCIRAFKEQIKEAQKKEMESVAFVVHGGTIMAILEAYGEPKRPYFEWQLKNGEWIAGEYRDDGKIYIDR